MKCCRAATTCTQDSRADTRAGAARRAGARLGRRATAPRGPRRCLRPSAARTIAPRRCRARTTPRGRRTPGARIAPAPRSSARRQGRWRGRAGLAPRAGAQRSARATPADLRAWRGACKTNDAPTTPRRRARRPCSAAPPPRPARRVGSGSTAGRQKSGVGGVLGVAQGRHAVHAGVRGRLRRGQTVRDADGPDKHVLHARECRSVPTATVLVGTPVGYVSGDISTSFGAIDLILGHSPGLGRPRASARARARRAR